MTDYSGNLPPAGWYPDPYGAPYERWWDGAQWTDHTNTPAAPEPVQAPAEPVYQAPTEPAYQAPAEPVQQEPVYQAPAEPVQQEPVYQAPAQTAEPAYQAPVQSQEQPTAEPDYKAPAQQQPWETPAASSSSFDDIFSTGQAPQTAAPVSASAQSAYTDPAPAAYAQPEPQAYEPPAAYDPYASQQPQQQAFLTTPVANSADDFGALITGGGAASGSSDPFDSWSNQDYEEPPTNTLATVGLTFGVLSFIIPGVAGLVGLVTSAIGLTRASRFKREEGVAIGRGKSIAGIALSIIGSAASIAFVLFVLPNLINPVADTTDDTSSEVVAPAPKTTNNYIDLQEGATGTILFAGTSDPSIQFVVTGITVSPACTEDPELVLTPENGQFVALTMEFTTSAEYATAMDGGRLLQVSPSDFNGLLEDGAAVVNTDAGLSCVPEAEQLPTEIAAGETVSGTVILDVTTATTSFSFAPSGVTSLDPATTRWEWAIPR